MSIYTHKNMCGKACKLIRLKAWREKKKKTTVGERPKTETLFFKVLCTLIIRWLTISHKSQKYWDRIWQKTLLTWWRILRIMLKLSRGDISPKKHQQVNTGTNERKLHVTGDLTKIFIINYNIFLQKLSALKEFLLESRGMLDIVLLIMRNLLDLEWCGQIFTPCSQFGTLDISLGVPRFCSFSLIGERLRQSHPRLPGDTHFLLNLDC